MSACKELIVTMIVLIISSEAPQLENCYAYIHINMCRSEYQ